MYTNRIWESVVEKATLSPDKVVLRESTGRSCSYAELVSKVDAFAYELQQQGVQKGDRVLFLERPSIRALQIFFALYRVGAVAVIADPAMGRENFKSRVEFAGCQYVVLDPLLSNLRRIPGALSLVRAVYPDIPELHDPLPTVITLPKHPQGSVSQAEIEVIPDLADALIIFTSGTTSVPKGVVHSFGSLFATLSLVQQKIHTDEDDIFFSSQLHFTIIALISGASAIVDMATTFKSRRFLSDLEKYKPTHTFLLPVEGQQLVHQMSRTAQTLPSTLQCVMFGSAPVYSAFLKRFMKVVPEETDVLCIYGSTEILPISITSAKEKIRYAKPGDHLGQPLPGISVEVREEEFLVSGPNLCARYLHEKDPLPYFTSGDIGHIDPEGSLVLTGRKKDMIIKDHYNIYPALFETTITKIPGVIDAALVGVYNTEQEDEEIHLCVEKEDRERSDAAFTKYLEDALTSGEYSIDRYALPDEIHIMTLPRNGRSRKVDKQALREQFAQNV